MIQKQKYGHTPLGEVIQPPIPKLHPQAAASNRQLIASGRTHRVTDPDGVWRILKEGEEIPHHYRAYHREYGWEYESWCHSTMTPIWACVWGKVIAYAVLLETETHVTNLPKATNYLEKEDFTPTPQTEGYNRNEVENFLAPFSEKIRATKFVNQREIILNAKPETLRELLDLLHHANSNPTPEYPSPKATIIVGYDKNQQVITSRYNRYAIEPVLQSYHYKVPLTGGPHTIHLYWY